MIHEMRDVMASVRREVQRVIVGQQEVVELVLTALLAGGHCLLVGVPGLAKTMLVRTLAQVLDLAFKRIQFTPDLMPVDITGTDVMETDEATGRRSFRFMRGPIFANLLLADEINRTPPKTQAALLEAMQEQSVTAGNTTYALDPPFFVLATQNPLEQEGTYPLPEAQLDRFMFNIHLDYPSEQEEPVIIDRTTGGAGAEPRRVLDGDQIQRCQRLVRQVPISRHVLTYVTSLVRATRPQTRGAPDFVTKYVHCGAGPRASQNLVLAAKARAVMNGRLNVSIDDVRAVAVPVLRHRIFTNFSADAENVSTFDLVRRLVRIVSEPKIRQEKALEREAEQEAGAGSSKDDRLVVQCPMCRKVLKVAAEAAGQSARCTHCGKVFPVEAGS
ncbi:MAG: AAA family ATPase [Phycisphaeraceae bacterium]|nr:AAA family ATPase [Phycisphaeraceae bacterium]